MKIKIITAVCLGDGVDAYPREVRDVPDILGNNLVSRGKAKEYDPETDKDPEPKALDEMKATELLTYAVENDLGLDSMKPQDGREKILAAVKAAMEAKTTKV